MIFGKFSLQARDSEVLDSNILDKTTAAGLVRMKEAGKRSALRVWLRYHVQVVVAGVVVTPALFRADFVK